MECLYAINTLKSAEMSFQKKGDPVLQNWNKQFYMNSPKGEMGYKTIFLCCFLLAFQLAGVFSPSFFLSVLTQSGNLLIK